MGAVITSQIYKSRNRKAASKGFSPAKATRVEELQPTLSTRKTLFSCVRACVRACVCACVRLLYFTFSPFWSGISHLERSVDI